MFRYNIAIAGVFGALSLYVMSAASRLQPAGMAKFGPGYWPYFLGSIMLLLSIGLLIETAAKRLVEKRRGAAAPEAPSPIRFASSGLICVYKLCALLLLFVLLLYYVNFIAATFVFVPACMWLLGRRDLPVMAAVTIGLPLAVYFIFTRLLRITLP